MFALGERLLLADFCLSLRAAIGQERTVTAYEIQGGSLQMKLNKMCDTF